MVGAAALVFPQRPAELTHRHQRDPLPIAHHVVVKRQQVARQRVHVRRIRAGGQSLVVVGVPAADIERCNPQADVELDEPRNGDQRTAQRAGLRFRLRVARPIFRAVGRECSPVAGRPMALLML